MLYEASVCSSQEQKVVAALHTRVCMFFACLLSVVCLCVVCVGQAPEGGLVFSVRVSGEVGCKTATTIPEVVSVCACVVAMFGVS